jgi:hypothetical protein
MILTKSMFTDLEMHWQSVQFMNKKERSQLIQKVINLRFDNCSFIHYGAKFHLAYLIHHSEPYFNGKGYQTKVKEFDELGWYGEGKDLLIEIVYKR